MGMSCSIHQENHLPELVFSASGESVNLPRIMHSPTQGSIASQAEHTNMIFGNLPLLQFWLVSLPTDVTLPLSPISLLQSGHDALIFNHLSTHSTWKTWEQGSSLSSSLSSYLARQMQQTWNHYSLLLQTIPTNKTLEPSVTSPWNRIM